MSRFFQVVFLACAVLLAGAAVSAEGNDTHLTSDPLRQLYQTSAYAHGYMHGYEQGFHEADLDIHMGHTARPVSQCKAYHSAGGYKPEFGNHSFYRLGYQQGFRAAYADAMRGDAFRALESLRRAAAGFNAESHSPDFDRAFSAGYDGGYSDALRQPAGRGDGYQNAAGRCLAGTRHNAGYCDGYARGYRLGFSDASANPQRTQTAEKQ